MERLDSLGSSAPLRKSVALFTVMLFVVPLLDASTVTGSAEFSSAEYYSSAEVDGGPTRPPPAVQLDYVYHNHSALTAFLKDVHAHYPTLTHLYSIGKSYQGMVALFLVLSNENLRF